MAQARSLKTKKNLMLALEELLKTKEFEHISIAEIAESAGLAVGSVYSHYKDKNAFLSALLEAQFENADEKLKAAKIETPSEILACIEAANDPKSLYKILKLAVESALQQIKTDAHIFRAIYTYNRIHNYEDERHSLYAEEGLELIKSLLNPFEQHFVSVSLDEAALYVNYFLNVAFIEKALFITSSLPENIEVPDDELIKSSARMLYGYLTLPDLET